MIKYQKERTQSFILLMMREENFMKIWNPQELLQEWNLLLVKKNARFSNTRKLGQYLKHIQAYTTFRPCHGGQYIFVKSRRMIKVF